MNASYKQLKRSPSDRIMAGVCGGLGEYLNVDALFIRLAWVLMVLAGGFGILLYIAWVVIVPVGTTSVPGTSPERSRSLFGAVLGGGLVLLGVVLLLDEWHIFDVDALFDWSWRFAGPMLLIIGGAYLIARRRSAVETAQQPAEPSEPADVPRSSRPRFQKSRANRKLFGVCGGLADYFEVDPTLVRLGVAGVTLAAPPFGIIGYLALAILAPTAEPHTERPASAAVSS